MEIQFESRRGDLVALLSGEADSLGGESGSLLKALRSIDERASQERPKRVWLDFRRLASMEKGAFRLIAEEIGWIAKRVPVGLLGPGPAMERFFAEMASPPGWRWEAEESAEPTAGVPPAAVPEASAGLRPEAFEIDLERESLLRESEAPAPAFNPLAEPLDLVSGANERIRGSGEEPARAKTGPAGAERPERPAERVNYLVLPEPPGGEESLPAAGVVDFGGLDLVEEGGPGDGLDAYGLEAEAGPGPAAREDAPAAEPPPALTQSGLPDPAGRREEFLKARLITSLLTEDCLRARIADLESQLRFFRSRAREDGVAQEARTAVRQAPGAPSRKPPRTALFADIPSFLRGDFPRASLVASVARLLEKRSRGRGVPSGAVLEIASSLADAVERAPLAGFDFSQARTGAHPAAQTVYLAATALCLLHSSGASRERLRRLALAALLQTLGGASAGPFRLLGEEGPSRNLARRLARRLSALLPRAGESGVNEEEVLDGLQLLELSQSFWQKIGPGPDGGAEPAAAAAALVRGEIGRSVPDHFRRLFLRAFSAFPPGTWVRLESGEVGVAVGPGTKDARGPIVLTLLAGGDRELRARPPRLVDTGVERGARVRAVVTCPFRICPSPPEILRIGTGIAVR